MRTEQLDLDGKVAVVTGASSGIGRATAAAFARAGCRVVAVARRGERLDALAAEVPGVVPHVADVTDPAAVAALVLRVQDDLGACHVLVNNAGVRSQSKFRGVDDLPDLERVVETNLLAVARCTAAFAPLLQASAPSRLVNVASVAGRVGLGSPAYSAAKFGVVGFSEALRGDWLRRGVAVSCVTPGFVHTEGFPQDRYRGVPLVGRLVPGPEPVADAIVDVARRGSRERTVPRFYRAFVAARHLAAPLFWGLGRRAVGR